MSTDITKLEDTIAVLTQIKNEWLCEKAIKPKLCTPPGVKFAMYEGGNIAGLLFNNNQQRLVYHLAPFSVYGVESIDLATTTFRIAEAIPLTPCLFKDLKPGDFYTDMRKTYMLKLTGDQFALPDINGSVERINQLVTDYKVWRVGK